MARKAWCHLQYIVTWLTRMELAWQLSVTTVRAGHMWKDVKGQDATHATFITLERVWLNWPVLPVSPHTASSLSSMSVIIQCYWELDKDGGCHVIILRWRTGEEHHLAVVSAHAGWTTRVQTPNVAVTVMLMTTYGVKTAVYSLTRQSFQSKSSGLVIMVSFMSKATTLWENSSVMVQHNHFGNHTHKETC